MNAGQRKKQLACAAICGAVCAIMDYWLIPNCFARGVEDAVWMTLMILLPTAVAVVLMKVVYPCRPRFVMVSFAVQCAIALVFGRAIGNMLWGHGYMKDLFDWIAYLMFAFGFAAGAALVQFVVLSLLQRTGKRDCLH